MTTLITGAAGFIGRQLAQAGDRRLVRKPSTDPHEVTGDLLDLPSLQRACEAVDTVFHCAGYAHAVFSRDAETNWRVNYEGTRNLLRAASQAGVARFVFLSSVAAMARPGDACVDETHPGEPGSAYGKAKRAAEDAVLETGVKYNLHAVNLRLPMVYGKGAPGNMAYMVRGIRAGWLPPLPETHNRRSVIYIADVLDAIRFVAGDARANGKTYIVADPRPYSGREIYDALRNVLGMRPANWRIPERVLRFGGRVGDALILRVAKTWPKPSEFVSRFLDSACYSPERIQKELGWKASIGLLEGLQAMFAGIPDANRP